MIRHIFLLATLAFLYQVNAQKPEPIYGFARTQMPLNYYKEQAIAWKKEVTTNPKNANAWYNYFRVTKNLIGVDSTDKRTRTEKWQDLKKLWNRWLLMFPKRMNTTIVNFLWKEIISNFYPT